jgi:hypothetical protein
MSSERTCANCVANSWHIAPLREHIEAKISGSELAFWPFPHVIIKDFFPADVYEEIIKRNLFRKNRGKEWFTKEELLKRKSSSPYDHRLQINFHEKSNYDANDEDREFWGMLTETFLEGNWFPKLVITKFPEYFAIRYGELAQRKDFVDRFRREFFLQRHEPGYYIGPHTDIPSRVFTCIFSFADRPGFERLGTLLMRHKDPMVRCTGYQHYTNWEDFEVVKNAEYRPNNFLLFFKTPHSFHAVKTITEGVPNQRYGMQFQFYEPKEGLFRFLT